MFKDYNSGAQVGELTSKYHISEESVKERLKDFAIWRDTILAKEEVERQKKELAKGDNGEKTPPQEGERLAEVDKPLRQ